MVIYSNGQYLFGLFLTDHIIIEEFFDLHRFQQVDLFGIFLLRFFFIFLFDDFGTDVHALIADIYAVRTSDQLMHLILCLVAEGTSHLVIRKSACHIVLLSISYFK